MDSFQHFKMVKPVHDSDMAVTAQHDSPFFVIQTGERIELFGNRLSSSDRGETTDVVDALVVKQSL